jgi:aryl-alcohol dehydrogenase-like predicted oxidoreductase
MRATKNCSSRREEAHPSGQFGPRSHGCCSILAAAVALLALTAFTLPAAQLPPNLALSARATATPEHSDQFCYSMLHREAERDILPHCAQHNLATLTYMSLEQGLLTGKIGMDRVFQPDEFRSNTGWNDWLIPVNRQRVLDLLASWQDLTDKYACTLSQLVITWTAAQPGVTHVLAGGRNIAQVTENAKAGELNLEAADLARIHQDVIALGEPVRA